MLSSKDLSDYVRAPAPGARRTASALRISIVMPSFNQAGFIERSLNSVINQEYEGVELIVMDGGSRDGTREILEQYSEHIAFWRSEPDDGQSDALNRGFRRASGEIFGWLNSDDLYAPGTLHHVADIFAAHPEIDVVYGDWLMIDEHDRILERCPALAPSRTRLVTEGFFCNAQALFWRRDLHERIGDFDIELHYTMDFDLFLRMISAAGPRAFHRTPRSLGCFRIYAGQKTGSAAEKSANEHLRVIERAGLTWKYAPHGRALRLVYRLTRAWEYLALRGPRYAMTRLAGRQAG